MGTGHESIWKHINSDEFEAALSDNLRSFEAARSPERSGHFPSVVCLGESHGSHLFTMSGRVLPGTGAILLRLSSDQDSDLILDPGWGSIAAACRLRIPLTRVGVILISHCHLDHVGDLHPLLVMLSLAGVRPVLIGNSTSINGGPGQPSVLPDYFRNLCHRVLVSDPDSEIALGPLNITPFHTKHLENPKVAAQSASYIVTVNSSEQVRLGFITDGPLGDLSDGLMMKLRECDALILNIGTISTLPGAPSHSRVFDNALCFHGLQRFLRCLALRPNRLRSLAVTHLGAELLEVRSPLMRRFLSKTAHQLPVDLLEPALREMVAEVLRSEVNVRVLREGDTMEV